MALVDPVKIYVGTSNVQAQMICRLLEASGVEAFASEDCSPYGLWLGGTVAGVFDAGVFVSRADADRAIAIIREQERLEIERSRSRGAELETTCEECGQSITFPAAQRGTVQDCPHCGAFLDVGGTEPSGDWDESEDQEDNEETTE